MSNEPKETAIISVDIETTGRDPVEHSILSIGLYACDIYGNKINTLEVFFKNPIWDDNTKGSVSEFWNRSENAKALAYNLNGVKTNGKTKEEMSDAITLFLQQIKITHHLVFTAAPTAYDLSWLIAWFGDSMPFPRKGWIDIYSFFAGLKFFLSGKMKTDHKEYSLIRKDIYYKWEGVNFKGEKHCALYDAYMQACLMVEYCGQFDHISAVINALKSHFE
jgi:hypothetical protein